MPSKNRKRWRPSMKEFKKVVAIVASEVSSSNVTDIFHAVRRRCPEWAVTPHRVRKALAALQNSAATGKKGGKQSGSGARSSGDCLTRAFPHDIVELRPHAARTRHAQWQWRGQVLRVAGYDDGEPTDDDSQELPPGHCSVMWLGHGLEQWPNALTKETSIRVLDRPWVLGDRVARSDNPRSLGTVVGVSCSLRLAGLTGNAADCMEAPVQSVRAVGGFRAEDWVASESSRWVGKVEEAVYRVEVELSGKSEPRARGRGRRKPPMCVFQVSSEGLPGLEPASGEDVNAQELSPHFPGQRVRAPARLWRQAEWIRGSLGRRSPRRGTSICGVVASVECGLIAVRWLAGAVRDSPPPDEWVAPDAVRTLLVPNSSEGWAIGDHVQATPEFHSPAAVVVESVTSVSVRWADGTVEEGVPSRRLCPRPHISAHDFLPHDFVARSGENLPETGLGGHNPAVQVELDLAGQQDVGMQVEGPEATEDINQDSEMYGYGAEAAQEEDAVARATEILPTEGLVLLIPETPLGVVTSVNLQARTAVVQWAPSLAGGPGEQEEVSVFELTDHPQIDVRLGDTVLVPDSQEGRWVGRVSALGADGRATVELLDGTAETHDVRRLILVDDGEGSESGHDDMASEGASTRSDAAVSEASEGRDMRHSDEEWAEAHEELQEDEEDTPRASAGAPAGSAEADGAAARDREAEEGAEEGAAASPAEGGAAAQFGGSSSSAAAAAGGEVEILAFDVCEEDVEPMDHYFVLHQTLSTRTLMAAVRREMVVLKKGLLEGSEGQAPIIVRTFSSRSDLFRAMVVGPPDTPYAYVPFFFDLALPAEYPREPPLAHFHARFVGNERLNPNLYIDGKVCLSLLGTWSGPAWDPQRSTLLQVLVSLQGLVLVEEPYYNEPGHECDAGTEQGRQSSALYNEHARLLALRAALNVAHSPPLGFREIVANYFSRYGHKLVEECEQALQEPKASQFSEGFRKVLAKTLLPRLQERWGRRAAAAAPPAAEPADASPSPEASASAASAARAAAAEEEASSSACCAAAAEQPGSA